MFKKLARNPFLIFSPFLFYYVYIIVQSKWPSLYGDEIRYVNFAKNLNHFFYSPPMPHINLWSGPGYPIILMPFVAMGMPYLYITLLNAIFQYFTVVLLYQSIRLISSHKTALIFGLLMAFYPNALSMLPILYTEALTGCLVSLFVYCITLHHIKGRKGYLITAGLILGYLVLTKIILGYTLMICLAVCLLWLMVKRHRFYYLKAVKMLLIALAVCVPYLVYTWHLTGKILYWGNSGGMSLYWMSTPYDHEYGDWKLPELTNNQYPILYKSAEAVALLKKNHEKEIGFILKHNEIEQDEWFKKAAIRNIEQHPLKFAGNYFYNVSRMLFNFPYSYSFQEGAILGNIIRGSLILWASLFGTAFTLYNWRKTIFPVKFLLLITGVYLLLSGALSAYPRQLDVVLPVLLFWFAFLASNIKKLDLRFVDQDNLDEISLSDLEDIGVGVEKTEQS